MQASANQPPAILQISSRKLEDLETTDPDVVWMKAMADQMRVNARGLKQADAKLVAEERQVIASTPDYNSPFNFDLPAPSGKPEEQELAQISGLKAVVADLRGRGLSVAVAVGADINTITVGWNSFDLTYTLKLGSDPEDGDTRSAFHYFMLYPGIETGTPKNDLGCYDLAATDKLGCRLSLRNTLVDGLKARIRKQLRKPKTQG